MTDIRMTGTGLLPATVQLSQTVPPSSYGPTAISSAPLEIGPYRRIEMRASCPEVQAYVPHHDAHSRTGSSAPISVLKSRTAEKFVDSMMPFLSMSTYGTGLLR